MSKTIKEHIQLLDNRIEKMDIVATKLEENGSDNDKAVAAILKEKIEKRLMKQKAKLESDK